MPEETEKKVEKKKEEKAPAWAWWLLGIISSAIIVISIIMIIAGKKEKEVVYLSSVIMPLCAGKKYDFSESVIPADLKVDFRSDCVTAVTLPPRVVFRTDPSSDVKIVFVDGSTYLDGPGRQVWYGLKKGVFKMHGISDSGILKIALEKKT
ncbi:MAG: hypothetical protein AAB405_01925 [Patescibacteria group bacterium]